MKSPRVWLVLLALVSGFLLAGTFHAADQLPISPEAVMARIEGPQSPNRQGLDPYTLQQVIERFRVPGVSVAVISDYQIHWAKAYGVADAGTQAPVTARTLFQAASISKPVMAMAVLTAVQAGRLSLDTDINAYPKSWKVPQSDLTKSSPVTLRSLLSHTSGAGDGFGFPGYDPPQLRPTLVQILNGEKPSNVGPVFFERPPFTAFKYSGGGMTIVQLALMDQFGKPFADIMRESVLSPLGMSDSTYEQPLPPGREAQAARAHSGQGRPMGARWHVYPEQGAAGLWTTPSDLARFAIDVQRALRGPKGSVLSQAIAKEMVAPTGVGAYAVGLSISKRGEGWYFNHGGGNWGFRCDLLAHVAKGYGVAVMTNGDGGGAVIEEIEARIAAAYGWDLLDKPVPR